MLYAVQARYEGRGFAGFCFSGAHALIPLGRAAQAQRPFLGGEGCLDRNPG